MAAVIQTIASSSATMAVGRSVFNMPSASSSSTATESLKPAFFGTTKGLERVTLSSDRTTRTASPMAFMGDPGWGSWQPIPGGPSLDAMEQAWKYWQRMQQQQQHPHSGTAPPDAAPWSTAPGSAPGGAWPGFPIPGIQQDTLNSLGQMLSDIFSGMVPPNSGWDVQEQENAWLLRIQLPGFSPEEVQVEVEDGRVLSIRAEPTNQAQQKGGFQDRRKASHTRLPLPDFIDSAALNAEVNNGVLDITLPKKKPVEEQPSNVRRVQVRQVKTAEGAAGKRDEISRSNGSERKTQGRRSDGMGGIFL